MKPFTPDPNSIKILKDKHKGQRGFVIGNGPSLNLEDLSRLEGEVTFASNKIYLAFNEISWRPTYYTVLDVLVAENNQVKIQKLKFVKVFPMDVYPYFQESDGIIWVPALTNPVGADGNICFKFSTDLTEGVYGGWTVIYTQLQIAFYMGIREIYLLGVDYHFIVPEPTGEVCAQGLVLEHQGEQNHFHPEYRKIGEKWTIPRLDIQYEAFKCARESVTSNGGDIYNASRRTALDIFPIVDLDLVLPIKT
jgi:hypothetical protein